MDWRCNMDYKTIGKALQIEGFSTHVDAKFANEQGVTVPENPTRVDGIKLFNEIAKKNELNPLNDPIGYMVLDDNLYNYVRDRYHDKYSETVTMVDNGLMSGGSYALNAVLDKLPSYIRKDMSPFMPEGLKYSDMRFIKPTENMKNCVNDYVDTRVRLTHLYSMRRSVEAATFEDIFSNLASSGEKLKVLMAESILETNELDGNKPSLSKARLLENSGNNDKGLSLFMEQLGNPDNINKIDDRPVASFSTSDIVMAKFLLANKAYLSEFGFEIVKANKNITTSWSSEMVDSLYAKQDNDVELDLSGLDTDLQL